MIIVAVMANYAQSPLHAFLCTVVPLFPALVFAGVGFLATPHLRKRGRMLSTAYFLGVIVYFISWGVRPKDFLSLPIPQNLYQPQERIYYTAQIFLSFLLVCNALFAWLWIGKSAERPSAGDVANRAAPEK